MSFAAGIGPYFEEQEEQTTSANDETTSTIVDNTTTDNASQLGLNFFLLVVICVIKIAM